MSVIASTSGRLLSEFVCLLFLQAHRETDRVFETSVDQLAQHNSGQIHYRRTAFSSQHKSKIGNIFTKTAALRITLNIDGVPSVSRFETHTQHKHSSNTLADLSSVNLVSAVSIFRCSSSPHKTVYSSHEFSQFWILVFHHTDTHI